MKKLLVLAITLPLILSCGKSKKEDENPGLFDIIDGVSDLNKIADEVEKMEEEGEKLINTTPISNDQLKKILPETLLGLPRKKFSVGNQFMADVAMAEAEYKSEEGNDNQVAFSIVDGAGEMGSAMISLVRMGLSRDYEEQTDNGYNKSTTINGYKAIEEFEKRYETTYPKIKFLINNRFLVSLEGKGVTMDQLKKALNELDLDDLKKA